MFQSTRPRGARRDTYTPMKMEVVSIHAPARGATHLLKMCVEFESFNPRARAGRD